MVFLAKPKQVPQALVFNRPKVNVDLNTLDSDVVRNLEPWSEIKTQFDYRATRAGQVIEGKVAATSMEEARKILEDIGLLISYLKESEMGRDNPFEPYSQQIQVPAQNNQAEGAVNKAPTPRR